MIHVLQSHPGGYRDIVQYLTRRGARLTNLGPSGGSGAALPTRLSIVLSMLSPYLIRAFGKWGRNDTVLVMGWKALPILALIKARLLRRPARLLIMGCFIHGDKPRRIVNHAWRMLRFPGLGFIAFSPGEARNLVDEVGIPAGNVHFHLWRQELGGRADASAIVDDGSIFAGGFSNRDYDLLLSAAAPLAAPLVIVASLRNEMTVPLNSRTVVHLDLPEQQFEQLLARSRVVAMPLRGTGEACGQSVLLRVFRNGKPLIATRHESIEAYLGVDYPGFVPHGSAEAMREALERALSDDTWRAELVERVRGAARQLDGQAEPGAEIERFLLA